jgi:hypothetical protein
MELIIPYGINYSMTMTLKRYWGDIIVNPLNTRCPQSKAANSQFLQFQAAAADLSSVTIGHFDVCCLVSPLVAYVG